MKPPRLKLMIVALVLIGLMTGLDGFLSTGGVGAWTSGTLICFFAAHLLSIPHNSGRYWAAFVVLGLSAISAVRIAAYFGLAGFSSSRGLPPMLGVGIPLLYVVAGLQILMLALHSSVCVFFDGINSGKPNREVTD